MPTKEAVSLAQSEGLDLVLVTPDASPPVCRVVDFGKYMYEQEKKKKEAKKGQRKAKSSVKELKMRPNTDVHDYNVRLKRAKQFLAKGNKVKVSERDLLVVCACARARERERESFLLLTLFFLSCFAFSSGKR